MKAFRFILTAALCAIRFPSTSLAQSVGIIDETPPPFDLNGSNFTYPWPVKRYRFNSQKQELEMAFMDVQPESGNSNNKTAVLFHGRNFCGATWEGTARALLAAGYRVVLPDQVGLCKSSKPERYQFSLQQFAFNTNGLLQALGVPSITLIGHSMGGMLAARYALMYPGSVEKLVMVNPIGLEDWKALGVPYIGVEAVYTSEAATSYNSIRAYEQATYYVGQWAPEYDVWVNMLVNIYHGSRRERLLLNQALIVDMVITQPVVYEFGLLKPKTLLIIGEKDNTAIGKQWASPDVQAKLGHYDVLGKQAAAAIPNSELIEFAELGHAPQIQEPERFYEALMGWLAV